MPSFYRTQPLKIEEQPIFSEVNAASAVVWNGCCYQMDMYQWHRGYPHAHRDFSIGKDCEGWIDKNSLIPSCIHKVGKPFGSVTSSLGCPTLL